MRNIKGLTIFEVLVVLGILAIVSAFVAPNFVSWRSDVKLRGAANNLKADLEMAKARAIRENNWVADIRFLSITAPAAGLPAIGSGRAVNCN
jgi:prepilin-type N-terminal cleavage/methylation domain-containing protein